MVARLSSRGAAERWVLKGALFVALCLAGVLGMTSVAEASKPPEIDDCMDCHEDVEDESFEFDDGSEVTIDVKRDVWMKSVHGAKLSCTDCHTTIVDDPHPEVTAKSRREFTIHESGTCKRCHYINFTRMLDGIHFKELAKGNLDAPSCVDCHGAHDTLKPGEPRSEVNKRCSGCHEEIAKAYESSVHGQALLKEENPDVPVCTDCHGAHDNHDPRSKTARASSFKVCERCHSDEERMEKYDLNTDVVSTYLDDFHGRSNMMYVEGGEGEVGDQNATKAMASCTDCHGIHAIHSFKDVGESEVRERVIKACVKCHEGVPDGFGDAWLRHYTPSLSSAPLVWAVTVFYQFVIPFILLGLILHILLHLWRYGFKRR